MTEFHQRVDRAFWAPQDAGALGCVAEVEHVENILARGNSADRQLGIYEQAIAEDLAPKDALARVRTWLQQETLATC